MREKVVVTYVGRFLKVFGLISAIPLLVSIYYGEPFQIVKLFSVTAILSTLIGYIAVFSGKSEKPTIMEGIISTLLGWILAIIFGSIPFFQYLGLFQAFFEAGAGFTTTGISMFRDPSILPHSVLFWRALIQWVGGLGILTFFITIIRESGGISRRIYSAEAHKTDPGSIRPSFKKSLIELWRVYGFLTILILGTYIGLGMPVFDSLAHAFTVISTGGFSTMAGSFSNISSNMIKIFTAFFMLLGATNFVLLYRFLRLDIKPLFKNSEYRSYLILFFLASIITYVSHQGFNLSVKPAVTSVFTVASLISSTGYTVEPISSFALPVISIFLGLMFVGGSLGSTTGGIKIFRIKVLIELLRAKIRSYSLPETAVNDVKIDGEIVNDESLKTISLLFFTWTSVVFLGTVVTIYIEDIGFLPALSGVLSATGNMGPLLIEQVKLSGLHPLTKILWIFLMLAGRLEMLPLLALFNTGNLKDKL